MSLLIDIRYAFIKRLDNLFIIESKFSKSMSASNLIFQCFVNYLILYFKAAYKIVMQCSQGIKSLLLLKKLQSMNHRKLLASELCFLWLIPLEVVCYFFEFFLNIKYNENIRH